MRTLVVCLLVLTGLAGCAGDDPGSSGGDAVDPGDFDLAAGRGAISGLLVDDRFRPIQLVNEPETAGQAAGFILLQETGGQARSNANGEFSFVNLEPGTYTLRAQVTGHEAVPIRVSVSVGDFAEATITARRTASEGSTIVTQEYSVFIPCSFRTIENGRTVKCIGDLSGDSFRSAFYADYTPLGKNTTYLITEMLPNQQGGYRVQVRNDDSSPWIRYGTENNYDTDYIRIDNPFGVANEEDNFYGDNQPWVNDRRLHTLLFPLGQFEEEVIENWPHEVYRVCCGLGARIGIQAKFIQSVFIGEPQVDPAAYCVLCPSS